MKNFEVDIHIMNCRGLIQYMYKNKVNLQRAELFFEQKSEKHMQTAIACYRNSFNCWNSGV